MSPLVSAIFFGCMIGPGESSTTPLESGYVNNSGVKLHHVTAGKGPLCILLHGFPDFHYSWRDQIPALAKHFKVVALDLRGFNLSDKPDGVEAYAMEKLTSDVNALLAHFGRDKAIIVGHDWGGAIAWSFAMRHPDKTERLVILNLPHPNGLQRELTNNPQQHKNSEY
ncbi:MAG: alpha/beta fold hydrolase, partial [Gemmataceae bacterium]